MTTPSNSVRRAVNHKAVAVVVHGVGDQIRSSELKLITEGFLPLVRNRFDPEAVISAKPADDSGPAEMRLNFANRRQAISSPDLPLDTYDIRFIEVWWQAAFNPPGLGELLFSIGKMVARWGSLRAWGPLSGNYPWPVGLLAAFLFLPMMILRDLLTLLIVLPLALSATPLLLLAAASAIMWQTFTSSRMPPAFGPVKLHVPEWMIVAHLRALDILTKTQPVIVELLVLLLLPVIVVSLLLLLLIQAVFPKDSLGRLKSLYMWLINFLTKNWGDMWLYVARPYEASRIRVRFEDQFEDLLSKVDGSVNTVMVLAHSMGSAVAYEALCGDRLSKAMTKVFAPGPEVLRWRGRPSFHFVSVGSALNIVWTLAEDAEAHRFKGRLPDYIDWMNLWTYMDPYARQSLAPPEGVRLARPSMEQPDYLQPVVDVEIVNQEDMFSDHSAYWNNVEQVMAPILNRLMGGRMKDSLRTKIRARLFRVRTLTFVKSIAWSAAPVVFISMLVFNQTGWPGLQAAVYLRDAANELAKAAPGLLKVVVAGLASLVPLVWVPDWIEDGVSAQEIRDHWFKPWVVALVLAGLSIFVYSTLVKWGWDLWDASVKYREPTTTV